MEYDANITNFKSLNKHNVFTNKQKQKQKQKQKHNFQNKNYFQITSNQYQKKNSPNNKNIFLNHIKTDSLQINLPNSISQQKTNQNNQKVYATPRKYLSIQEVRQKIMINKAIQGILTLGRLEKMKYVTINNKAIFNKGKIKRSQWMNKKQAQNKRQNSFLPDLQFLRISHSLSKKDKSDQSKINLSLSTEQNQDSHNHKNGNISPLLHSNYKSQNLKTSQDSSKLTVQLKNGPIKLSEDEYQKLIEQYIQKIKKENLLNKFNSRQQLVQQACKQIKSKMTQIISQKYQLKQRSQVKSMAQIKSPKHLSPKKNKLSIFQISNQKSHRQKTIKNKKKKPSFTQITYGSQIEKVLIYLSNLFRFIKTNSIRIKQDKIIKRCSQEELNQFQFKIKEIRLNNKFDKNLKLKKCSFSDKLLFINFSLILLFIIDAFINFSNIIYANLLYQRIKKNIKQKYGNNNIIIKLINLGFFQSFQFIHFSFDQIYLSFVLTYFDKIHLKMQAVKIFVA